MKSRYLGGFVVVACGGIGQHRMTQIPESNGQRLDISEVEQDLDHGALKKMMFECTKYCIEKKTDFKFLEDFK